MAAIGAEPEVVIADSYGQGDGLNRFVLTLAGSQEPMAVESQGVRASVDEVSGETSTPGAEQKALSMERFKAAQGQWGPGSIVAFNNRVYYVVDDNAIDVSSDSQGEVLKVSEIPKEDLAKPAPMSPSVTPVEESQEEPQETVALPSPLTYPAPSDDALAALSARSGVVSVQVLNTNEVLVSSTLTLDEVKSFPEVSGVRESVEVPVFDVKPNDPMYASYAWSLNNTGSNAYQQTATAGSDISAEVGWSIAQGQDTIIAVIDTGFDSDHPDLAGSLWSNPTEACGKVDTNSNGKAGDCHGWNFYKNSSDVDNSNLGSHGTSVSGVAAARINNAEGSVGVAPKAKIMPLVIGGGETVNMELAAEAIRYAADNGANVINASFGGTFSGQVLNELSAAIDYAAAKGVLTVAAAGNDAKDRDANPVYPASMTNPGVLTVGSTDASDRMAATSAYGKTAVDMFAPGEKVFTTWNDGGYRLVSGTSIAAPHVAGAAALYHSARPGIDAETLKAMLLSDSDKLSALGAKSVSGGRLNVGKIQAAGSNPNENVSYSFTAMNHEAGSQSPKVIYNSTASNGSYSVKLGLAMNYENEIWAVSGEDVTLNGVTLTTNDLGEVTFDLGTKTHLPSGEFTPGLTLGEGQYALTAQIIKNDAPMTRPYAAPLNVTSKGDTTPPGGGEPSPEPSAPGATDPTPEPSQPGTPNPTPSVKPTTPATEPTPKPSAPTTNPPAEPNEPGTPNPTPSVKPTTPPAEPTPKPSAPGVTEPTPKPSQPGTPNPTPSVKPTTPTTEPTPKPSVTPSEPTPKPTTPPSSGGPSAPGVKDYDQVGDFKVTSISPTNVGLEGGETVTITGLSLESGVSVRVGATRNAKVIISNSSTVMFTAPSAVAGTYDVTVYKNGKSSVLSNALSYSDKSAPIAPSDPTPGPTEPGTGNPSPTTPNPTPSVKPTNPTGPGGNDGEVPSQPNATKVGPNGERLVRNDALSSLAGLWSIDCKTTCSGAQV